MASQRNRIFGFPPIRVRAFSLIEVVIAMGIIAFALIVIMGLLPIGLKSNRDSIQESQAVNLLQALVTDRQASDYSVNSSIYNLPALNAITTQTTGQLYVMEDIATTNAQPGSASYLVSYTIYPAKTVYPLATNYPSSGLPEPVSMNFKVSWPAQGTTPSASVEMLATFLQQ